MRVFCTANRYSFSFTFVTYLQVSSCRWCILWSVAGQCLRMMMLSVKELVQCVSIIWQSSAYSASVSAPPRCGFSSFVSAALPPADRRSSNRPLRTPPPPPPPPTQPPPLAGRSGVSPTEDGSPGITCRCRSARAARAPRRPVLRPVVPWTGGTACSVQTYHRIVYYRHRR